ncbi:MAG: histidine kinase [Rhizobiaceae bacterium]|nr:histidine kinase [Rhizobiaceae bacterium]MCV0405470.1 histidine kinase [Rhizobiaceae bacterium]
MKFGPGSLAFRVIAFSSVWAILALVVIATIISALFRQASERGFESLLSAHLFNLISAVSVGEDGRLEGSPDLGDLRFSMPRSGWYWSVTPVTEGLEPELRSGSLVEPIDAPTAEEIPFTADFQRRYITDGLAGEEVQVYETEFALGSEGESIARFRVMGNLSELEAELSAFDRTLYIYLALFGAGMIALNAAVILFGLRPLGRVREALTSIRTGAAKKLDGSFPDEIQPLATETNALIENNRRIIERARTQVGNLAHSLKTPLAVIVNEGRSLGGSKGSLIAEQADMMTAQVEHYLQRARIAAQRESVVFRTPVAPVLERLVRVMAKLQPKFDIALEPVPEGAIFAGEREDLEEIVGNLLENATKWGKATVRVSVAPRGDMIDLVIEDDGPGIPPDKAHVALKRGRRLDETKPGTGLGLAIVSDLAAEYGGSVALGQSDLGGLRAVVSLRRAEL